jgi:hypothetical protein
VRRLFLLLAVLAGFGLVAAAPRTPTPHPNLATPPPLARPSIQFPSLDPTVLIYPFDTEAGYDAKAGTQIANIFSQEFAQTGHMKLLPIPANVVRANYLTNAQSDRADYYVSGYVTPIGNGASVVVQVVSVRDGVIVFEQTSQLYGINDAEALALTTHDAILELAGVDVNLDTAQTTATAAPSSGPTNGASFNLGNLFSHHRAVSRVAATPTPRSKPERGVILVAVHGADMPASQVDRATSLLMHDLATHFTVRYGGTAPENLDASATTLCGSDRDNTIATGTLAQERVSHLLGSRQRSVFTLQIWTCFGDVLYHTTKTDFDVAKAISEAVAAYVSDHPENS